MTTMCDEAEGQLVAFHFGMIEAGPERERLEAHLATCGGCVRAFLDIKRAIEVGAAGGEAEAVKRPSKAARERLRRAVAREVAPAAPEALRPRRWWERPVAFAIAASVVLAAGATTRAITSGPGSPPYGMTQQ